MLPEECSAYGGAEEETEFETTRFLCPQCGAEIISADNTAAAFCSFCGASTVLQSRISREKRPDGIIPFQLTKEDCVQSYIKMMKRSLFAPKELKDAGCIESFRGIYMPYWIYSLTQKGVFAMKGEKYRREGNYNVTRYYRMTGELDASYEGITHDASSEFSDDISESAAPYDTKRIQPFYPSYLSGFYADTGDVSPELYANDAAQFANRISMEQIVSHPAFAEYHPKLSAGKDVPPQRLEPTRYAMFPVWFMSYRKRDRVSYVTINGQTGKIAADIPVDGKKYALGSLLLAIPIFLLLNLLFTLTATRALIVSAVFTLITAILAIKESGAMAKKERGDLDRGKNSVKNRYAMGAEGGKSGGSALDVLNPILCGGAIITAIAIILLKPVSDYWYYGGAFGCIVVIFVSFIRLLRVHNILASRKLPQFNRTGGDDRA